MMYEATMTHEAAMQLTIGNHYWLRRGAAVDSEHLPLTKYRVAFRLIMADTAADVVKVETVSSLVQFSLTFAQFHVWFTDVRPRDVQLDPRVEYTLMGFRIKCVDDEMIVDCADGGNHSFVLKPGCVVCRHE